MLYQGILKISKLMKLLVKMENVSFILWKKLNVFFGQPNIRPFCWNNPNITLQTTTNLATLLLDSEEDSALHSSMTAWK